MQMPIKADKKPRIDPKFLSIRINSSHQITTITLKVIQGEQTDGWTDGGYPSHLS